MNSFSVCIHSEKVLHGKRSVIAKDLKKEGRDEWADHRGFLGQENTLCDTIMMDTCYYSFV